jgi:hypothetical protein
MAVLSIDKTNGRYTIYTFAERDTLPMRPRTRQSGANILEASLLQRNQLAKAAK